MSLVLRLHGASLTLLAVGDPLLSSQRVGLAWNLLGHEAMEKVRVWHAMQ